MAPIPEILKDRERFYVSANMMESRTGCGDERPGDDEAYINIFGGPALNVAWNLMVLEQAELPGSVTTTFAVKSGEVTRQLVKAGIDVVVHSDEHTEESKTINLKREAEDDLGCGYAKLRQTISRLIGKRGDEIIDKLVTEKPELYASSGGRARLQSYIDANARLAGNNAIFTSGRDVAREAVANGAATMVVEGEHISEVGILNKHRGTTIHTRHAWGAGLPTYNHNTWAAIDSFIKIKNAAENFPLLNFEAANDVDAVGTMLALGVKEIGVRR